MTLEFRFPDVGEGITEGTLLRWLVKEGAKVKADQPVAEIETGKAVVEIPAPRAGVVEKFFFKEGGVIRVGQVIFSLAEEGETGSQKVAEKQGAKTAAKEEKPSEKKREFFGVVGELEEAPAFELKVQPKSRPEKETGERVLAIPATRKLAKDLGIDISHVKGTGKDKRVTSEDVAKFAKENTPKTAEQLNRPELNFDRHGRILRIPLTQVRKEIAKTMALSMYSSPHAVAMEEIDISAVSKIRDKEKVFAENKGIHLTFMAFLVKVCVAVLKDHPYLNAFFDGQRQEIVVKQYFNIGVAVDTPAGLMVPNIKDANKKSILDVAHDIELLAEKARTRTVALVDLQGGTFTITNYGSIAGTFGVPIINYGESAILGVGRAQDKPVVVDGKIVVRKILPVSLSFDHRVVDGAQAAEFLKDLKKHLEDPDFLLVELD